MLLGLLAYITPLIFAFHPIAVSHERVVPESGDETKKGGPTLNIHKEIDDSLVMIYCKMPEKMFLELSIYNRQGFVVHIPFSKEMNPGEDSMKLQVGNYLNGSYYVQCHVNHSARAQVTKLFRHARKRQHVTYSAEEMLAHDKLPSCDQSTCTVGDLSSYDKFLRTYPNDIDKGKVFERALLAYVKLDQDSLLISRTIDSLVTYLPSFYTYYMISKYLTENRKFPSVREGYIFKAHATLASIPVAYQNEFSAKLTELERKRR